MVRALPDDPRHRYECVDGELLVSPAPRPHHQIVLGELYVRMKAYLAATRVGITIMAPSDVELDPKTLVQPDLYVVPRVSAPTDEIVTAIRRETIPLLLFVEVLSPSTARYDRVIKRQRYLRAGVEYWIVDADAQLIDRWVPSATHAEAVTDRLVWKPRADAVAFDLDIAEFFAAVAEDTTIYDVWRGSV
jgi:Uma2 family endonuclease